MEIGTQKFSTFTCSICTENIGEEVQKLCNEVKTSLQQIIAIETKSAALKKFLNLTSGNIKAHIYYKNKRMTDKYQY